MQKTIPAPSLCVTWVVLSILILPSATNAQIRYSEYEGGQQIWIPVELFTARSDNYAAQAGPEFTEDLAADSPLSGAAYYFPEITEAEYWRVGPPEQYQADAWVEYQIQATDVPAHFNLSGTWYFYTRCQHPSQGLPDSEYNLDSNWLVVHGDPGDVPAATLNPTNADWLTAVFASVRAEDRITNDVTVNGGVTPGWTWIGYQADNAHNRPKSDIERPKTMTLIDGKFTFRIYEAEAYALNARIDVICWANADSDAYFPADEDFTCATGSGNEPTHTTTSVDPVSADNDADAVLTITGTDLEVVTGARLISTGDDPDIIATSINVGPGPGETTMTAEFPTTGAALGVYHVRTEEGGNPCANVELFEAFELTCPNPTVISAVSPSSATDPGVIQLTISGSNVNLLQLDSVKLELGGIEVIDTIVPTLIEVNGDDLVATFDMSCTDGTGPAAGRYRVVGTRADGCPAAPLDYGFLLRKQPPGNACSWRPWAASWSSPNLGEDLDPPNAIYYNPTNWDYSFSQTTELNTPQDTPDASAHALHYFFDAQPPEQPDPTSGSGGVYQEISVAPGVPLEYSLWWKGAADSDLAWFEVLLIDGPFSIWEADRFQSTTEGTCNPSIVRKREITGGPGSFAWEQVTDGDPAHVDACGTLATTITPTGDVATIVLKAGRSPQGAMEAFFDDVQVWQGAGSNLLVNGDFEVVDERWFCDNQAMATDGCELDTWLWADFVILPPCPDPFADWDEDGDVDQVDFHAYQLCFTGPAFPSTVLPEGCECFDRPEPVGGDGDVDATDFAAFAACTSGPEIPADPDCDGAL